MTPLCQSPASLTNKVFNSAPSSGIVFGTGNLNDVKGDAWMRGEAVLSPTA